MIDARGGDLKACRIALAFCLVLAACPRPLRSVMFAGDSNTHFLPCAYPILWQQRHDPGQFRGYDEGISGSAAFGWIRDGTLADRLQRDLPRQVVLALGTNDIGLHRTVWQTLSDIRTLYRQAEAFTLPDGTHPVAYVATIPPVYQPALGGPSPANALLDAQVVETNRFLRIWFPRDRVVDFDSWMPAVWTSGYMYWPTDGVHVGCLAHQKRADVLDEVLG